MNTAPKDLKSSGTPFRDQPPGAVDFTLMFLTHDAFQRDLRRFRAAVAEGRSTEESVRNGWETVKHELHIHHVGEDAAIWPALRERLTDPEAIAVLDMMESEHALIDPLQARIDAALETGGAELSTAVQDFATSLATHMEHEENLALPLVEAHLGPEGWGAYHQHMISTQGLAEVGGYLAWVLDDTPVAQQDKVLGMLPEALRTMFDEQFEPAYRATPRWISLTA
ncbi:hemerythrin domain-containing protein [Streptomyces sp. NPDC058576]|uniref:hemerythrin domain-containing protein n=1 Tax=Streptomyces sp. NPDC058576 TaxID=3346547 RepID=UPI00366A0B63